MIYFKRDVTEEEISAFSQQILSEPANEGRGHHLRDGIGLQLRVFPSVQGHEAIAITFLATATSLERKKVKSDIVSSPIVYKVLENIAPADVKQIE